MKTLVIHPFDHSTAFLSVIYEDKDFTVIDHNPSKKELVTQIKEHDRIIMLGHGDEYGLFGFNRRIINSELVYLLREKICVCIWCFANDFVEKYNLKGVNTGMIISEHEEMIYESIYCSDEELLKSNRNFAKFMANNIDNPNILECVETGYIGDNDVVEFNKKRIYLNE